MEKEIIKQIRIVFAALLLATALATVAFDIYIPKTGIDIGADIRYVLEITSVASVIIVVPLAIKAFDIQWRRTTCTEHAHLLKQYRRISVARLFALSETTIINMALYYVMQTASPLYCALISVAAMIYCYPTKEHLRICIDKAEKTTTQTPGK